MLPFSLYRSPSMALNMEDFPDPTCPTIATREPCLTLNDMSLRTAVSSRFQVNAASFISTATVTSLGSSPIQLRSSSSELRNSLIRPNETLALINDVTICGSKAIGFLNMLNNDRDTNTVLASKTAVG